MDRKREDPVQVIQHGEAVAFVKMKKHLGICGRGKVVTCRDELGAQLAIVVDLAVEDERKPGQHTSAGIGANSHRLAASRRQIDDRQAPVTEPGGWSAVRRQHRNPFAVRAAVRHGVGHCLKEILREVTLKPDNPAHFDSSSRGGWASAIDRSATPRRAKDLRMAALVSGRSLPQLRR